MSEASKLRLDGPRLEAALSEAGLTMNALQCNYEIGRGTIYGARGGTPIKQETAQKIAAALRVPLERLIADDQTISQDPNGDQQAKRLQLNPVTLHVALHAVANHNRVEISAGFSPEAILAADDIAAIEHALLQLHSARYQVEYGNVFDASPAEKLQAARKAQSIIERLLQDGLTLQMGKYQRWSYKPVSIADAEMLSIVGPEAGTVYVEPGDVDELQRTHGLDLRHEDLCWLSDTQHVVVMITADKRTRQIDVDWGDVAAVAAQQELRAKIPLPKWGLGPIMPLNQPRPNVPSTRRTQTPT